MNSNTETTCENILFPNKARILIVGSSISGKSQFIFKLIKEKQLHFESPPKKVYYFCHTNTDDINFDEQTNHNVQFINGMPSESQEFDPASLIVIDDALCGTNKEIELNCGKLSKFFTRDVHHSPNIVGIILVSQSLYLNSSAFRVISANVSHMIIFKSLRMYAQLNYLATQIGIDGKRLKNIYKAATQDNPYTYLLIDLSNQTSDKFRFRSNILFEREPYCVIIYQLLEEN